MIGWSQRGRHFQTPEDGGGCSSAPLTENYLWAEAVRRCAHPCGPPGHPATAPPASALWSPSWRPSSSPSRGGEAAGLPSSAWAAPRGLRRTLPGRSLMAGERRERQRLGDPGSRPEAREGDNGDGWSPSDLPPAGRAGWPRGRRVGSPLYWLQWGRFRNLQRRRLKLSRSLPGRGRGMVTRARRLLTDTQRLTMPEPHCLMCILVQPPTTLRP